MSTRDLQKTAAADGDVIAVRNRVERRLEYLADELEPGEAPPSEAAQQACIRILTAIAERMPVGSPFPLPHISTNGEGDLSCEWPGDGCTVIALITAGGVVALHEMRLKAGRVVEHRTTADPAAADLHVALDKWLLAASLA
jgi:hypothetical protein